MALQDTLSASWQELLADEFEKPYWSKLETFVEQERADNPGKIYPPEDKVFAALNFADYADVKVVLIGQDPYHGPGQAHGLSFSVEKGVSIDPKTLTWRGIAAARAASTSPSASILRPSATCAAVESLVPMRLSS